MQTKRVTISSESYTKLFNSYVNKHGNNFSKKGDAVAAEIESVMSENSVFKAKECIELNSDTQKRVDMLIKLGISDSVEQLVSEAIESYLGNKKEEMKKMVDAL